MPLCVGVAIEAGEQSRVASYFGAWFKQQQQMEFLS